MKFELKGGTCSRLCSLSSASRSRSTRCLRLRGLDLFGRGRDQALSARSRIQHDDCRARGARRIGLVGRNRCGSRCRQADVIVTVRIVGADGMPKDDLKVEATLRRPTDASLDRTIALDAAGNGKYRAVQNDVSPGQWDVIARATSSDGDVFEAQRRVVLP